MKGAYNSSKTARFLLNNEVIIPGVRIYRRPIEETIAGGLLLLLAVALLIASIPTNLFATDSEKKVIPSQHKMAILSVEAEWERMLGGDSLEAVDPDYCLDPYFDCLKNCCEAFGDARYSCTPFDPLDGGGGAMCAPIDGIWGAAQHQYYSQCRAACVCEHGHPDDEVLTSSQC